MTKNRSMKIAVLVLALALLTSCFIGSTFAKYTSTGDGTSSVQVATWGFEVDGQDITQLTGEQKVTFNLFSTIEDTKNNAADPENDEDYTEEDVVDNKIAPGTKGAFHFALENTSEVTAQYTITLTPTLNEVPIKWYIGGAEKTIGEVNAALTAVLEAGASANSVEVVWEWAFEGDDNAYAGRTVTVDATFTATQVD